MTAPPPGGAGLRAMRFYEVRGWSADGARRVERVWGIDVSELCYRRALH